MQIPEQVQWILDKLEENGKEGYAVGGCVRDSVLGHVPKDWDITTSAKPEEVKADLSQNYRYRNRTWNCNRYGGRNRI